MRRHLWLLASLVGCMLLSVACPQATPTPTPRPAFTATPTATLPPLQPSPATAASPPPVFAWPTPATTATPLPAASPTPAPTVAAGGQYTVQSGDTLYSIARRHGVSVDALKAANNLTSNIIYAGMKLTIPDSSFVIPTATPAPVRPTATSTAATTPTTTPTPAATTPTATPTPLVTPAPAFSYRVESITRIPNCGVTHIWGYVKDAAGNPLSGQQVKVGTVGWPWSALSNVTGSDGRFEVTLSDGMKSGRWYAIVVDSAGTQISDWAETVTDDDPSHCQPEGSGNQTPRIDFRRRS